MKLYIVRHGTTDWNAQCRFQGRIDIELNSNGRILAGKLGEKLEKVHFDCIFSSPLSRAYETANLIRGHRNIQIIKNDLLTEIAFGEFEGSQNEVFFNTDDPRKYFFSEPQKYIPPKGGETFEQICQRSKKFVQTVIESKFQENPNGCYMIVAHGALIASMICYLENHGIDRFWGNGLKGNCEEAIYDFDGKTWKNVSPKKVISKDDENSAQITAEILQNGGIAILPTDTVYGFSAVVNPNTDKKIREIKGRAENKPFIQLIAEPNDIFSYTDDTIPPEILAKWPGALTIIVHNKNSFDGEQTTAFRCPQDRWLRNIIKQCKTPIFSTSVNKSGCPILETPQEIQEIFKNQVDLIVDDGEKKGALPSTLIKLENGKVQVLRQGEVFI